MLGPRGSFEVRSRFSCVSSGVIYCIICVKCGDLYVGETGRMLGDRFREHRQDVIQKREGREVASHFNQGDHAGVEDMRVVGLLYENGLISRKLKEQKLIARFGCVLGRGMNTEFNFPSLLQD